MHAQAELGHEDTTRPHRGDFRASSKRGQKLAGQLEPGKERLQIGLEIALPDDALVVSDADVLRAGLGSGRVFARSCDRAVECGENEGPTDHETVYGKGLLVQGTVQLETGCLLAAVKVPWRRIHGIPLIPGQY